MVRSVVEGLALATRDCYHAMGELPSELRLSGGAARSKALRQTLAAAMAASVRVSQRDETGAAGAAMMAAVSIGAYATMDDCIAQWVTPFLGTLEPPNSEESRRLNGLAQSYDEIRHAAEVSAVQVAMPLMGENASFLPNSQQHRGPLA
jgi:erythritol kinase